MSLYALQALTRWGALNNLLLLLLLLSIVPVALFGFVSPLTGGQTNPDGQLAGLTGVLEDRLQAASCAIRWPLRCLWSLKARQAPTNSIFVTLMFLLCTTGM